MRVLLISVNREEFPDPVYPLGVALVAAAAEGAGHEVRVLDLRWVAPEKLAAGVAEWGPDVVGLGIRNVDNLTWGRSVSYLPEVEVAVAQVRSAFPGPLVLGGSGFSLFPRELLARLRVPYGVAGEGERAFPALLAALAAGRDPEGIPGVAVCRGPGPGDVRVTPPALGPLAPNPFRPDLLAPYLAAGASVGVQTRRGCSFRCLYCTYPALEGRAVRLRDPDVVADEVEAAAGAGARNLFFVDDAFNAPADHAEAVCRRLVERGVRATWTAFVHPGHLPSGLARWMARAGCAGVEFGTDSLDDRVLAALDKGFTARAAAASARAAAEAGLPAAHYLLLGSPGETPETLERTLAAFDHLPPAAVLAMAGVRIYPGTPLADRARAEGVCGPGDLVEPRFYLSPAVDPEALLRRLGEHARARRGWVVPALGIRCDPAVLARLRRRPGPTWAALLQGGAAA